MNKCVSKPKDSCAKIAAAGLFVFLQNAILDECRVGNLAAIPKCVLTAGGLFGNARSVNCATQHFARDVNSCNTQR